MLKASQELIMIYKSLLQPNYHTYSIII